MKSPQSSHVPSSAVRKRAIYDSTTQRPVVGDPSRLSTDKSKGKKGRRKEGKNQREASSLKGDPRKRRRVPHARTLGRVHKSWAEPRSSSSITRQNTHNRSAGARWQFLRTLCVYKQHRWPPWRRLSILHREGTRRWKQSSYEIRRVVTPVSKSSEKCLFYPSRRI